MKNKDVIIESFNQVNVSRMKLPFIVIYDHPIDYINSYVARLFDVNKPTNIVILSDDLETLRRKIPEGMVRFDRHKEDDEKIVESYC
ncbi:MULTISPECIES: hypothetical protein [unclassified Clostridium]|uniref:hypothetical protein n=1 Tax=unclassified Clostridium TaxID=2614128 RepID=UPI0002978727|nr:MULTISPECIES: hypothetical protein [unclassified Clostridium]EKQ50280.1 MAG: hypothetical protein A370_05726 [Clostridium sp. Maddingley MBC34-26]